MTRRRWTLLPCVLAAVALGGCAARAPLPEPAAGRAVLEVWFHGPEADAGDVVYALYAAEASFESGESPTWGGSAAMRDGLAGWSIELPVGSYAVKAFLDLNGNGQLDRGALGRPVEPYGFSNDARGRFGPPSWNAARFSLESPRTRLEIRLH